MVTAVVVTAVVVTMVIADGRVNNILRMSPQSPPPHTQVTPSSAQNGVVVGADTKSEGDPPSSWCSPPGDWLRYAPCTPACLPPEAPPESVMGQDIRRLSAATCQQP